MATNHIIERVRKDLIESGRDTRYRPGAYEFTLNGMEFYLTCIGEKRHVSGQELSKGLLVFAKKQFGPLSAMVFNYWGITKTEDLGNIVYNLIDIGVMSKQPDDSIEHFYEVMDIGDFFNNQDYFEVDKTTIKKLKGA